MRVTTVEYPHYPAQSVALNSANVFFLSSHNPLYESKQATPPDTVIKDGGKSTAEPNPSTITRIHNSIYSCFGPDDSERSISIVAHKLFVACLTYSGHPHPLHAV